MNELTDYSLPERYEIEEVIEALLDEQTTLDPKYLYTLSDLRPKQLRKLKEIWDAISVERRRALLEDLEALTEADTLLSYEAVFRFAIEDPDPQVRFYAVRAIEVFDTDDLVSTFLSLLLEDESEDVRAVSASVLGKYVYRGELDKIENEKQRRIVDRLLEVLRSGDTRRVRRRALEAVSYSPRAEVHEEIQDAYQRPEPEWIASALFAMGRSYDMRYREVVEDRLRDESPLVRMEAVRACGELQIEDVHDELLDLLDDVPRVRRAAIWSLSQVGGEGVQYALNRLLEEEHLPAEEIDLIQQALDNLAFTEGSVNYSMFDMPYAEDEGGELPDQDWLD